MPVPSEMPWYDSVNLMQGSGGAVVAAVLGGLVAALVAAYTVRATRRIEREAAREARREEAAAEVYRRLLALRAGFTRYRVGHPVAHGDADQLRDLWTRSIGNLDNDLHNYLSENRPALTGALETRLFVMQTRVQPLILSVFVDGVGTAAGSVDTG